MTIYGLQANHLTAPLGFALPQLSLSWKVKDAAGKKQKAAQVIISNAKTGKIFFNSFDRHSSKNSLIHYTQL